MQDGAVPTLGLLDGFVWENYILYYIKLIITLYVNISSWSKAPSTIPRVWVINQNGGETP